MPSFNGDAHLKQDKPDAFPFSGQAFSEEKTCPENGNEPDTLVYWESVPFIIL